MPEAEEPRSVIQPMRAEAVARARQGALAVLDPATGWLLSSEPRLGATATKRIHR
jgi:hypothetical protein